MSDIEVQGRGEILGNPEMLAKLRVWVERLIFPTIGSVSNDTLRELQTIIEKAAKISAGVPVYRRTRSPADLCALKEWKMGFLASLDGEDRDPLQSFNWQRGWMDANATK